ncbi:MAG: hypothetical protein WC378_09090 [Opitutaceae bacterium]|jgi:hypothetical protein
MNAYNKRLISRLSDSLGMLRGKRVEGLSEAEVLYICSTLSAAVEAFEEAPEAARVIVPMLAVSRRDHFAALALQGLLANPHPRLVIADLPTRAKSHADALIAQLDGETYEEGK